MAVQILSLASGSMSSSAASTMYTSPLGPPGITTIIKSIRLVNTSGSAVTVNLYLYRTVGDPNNRRIAPVAMSIPANGIAIDDQEITMSANDVIKGDASTNAVVDFVISGIQR
jgi:hypothetical protein